MAATGHSQGTTEDFDNSFDYFEGSEKDPWNGQTWGKNASLDSSFDSSFDDGLFEFSATSSVQGLDADLDSQSLFFTDPFSLTPPRKEGPVTIRVAMHEQLSALYDDESADTSCQVEGSIHVKPTTDIKGPFHLTIRDVMNQLGRIEVKPDICRDVSDKISRKDLQKQDRVLRVSLPPNAMNQEIPIARYYCELSLRPVPMVCVLTILFICWIFVVFINLTCFFAPHLHLYTVGQVPCTIRGQVQSRWIQGPCQPNQQMYSNETGDITSGASIRSRR
jgi:hypothetical protein